ESGPEIKTFEQFQICKGTPEKLVAMVNVVLGTVQYRQGVVRITHLIALGTGKIARDIVHRHDGLDAIGPANWRTFALIGTGGVLIYPEPESFGSGILHILPDR